ncbi:MAG: hypothetical protein JWM80_5490 [Cyanobacteria bacterium RYN_339]|nr:hypothetical protein [Cyanobacteria bacterium RYN_339]
MSRSKFHPLCTILVASLLLATGCGRTPVDPLAPTDSAKGDKPATDPGGEEPGPGPVVDPGTGGGSTGGGSTGGGSTGGGAKPAPAPAKPASGLKPIPKPTPIPAAKAAAGGGGSDPAKAMNAFVGLLQNFGYDLGEDGVANARMQLQPLLHAAPAYAHWVETPDLIDKYNMHKDAFAKANMPLSFEQWKAAGVAMCQRDQSFTFYVARKELYRGILKDRYHDVRSDKLLIFYKRLNRTNQMVTYTADGGIDDFGLFGDLDWRNFILVPGEMYN